MRSFGFRLHQVLGAMALSFAAILACEPASAAEASLVTVIGTLSDEGVECPAMRGDDGTLYTLTPKTALGLIQPGARVKVEGTVAEISTCQQGTTIEVTSIEPTK